MFALSVIQTVLCLAAITTDGSAADTAPGRLHPDFVLPDGQGRMVRLSDYRGRKVILIHFASW